MKERKRTFSNTMLLYITTAFLTLRARICGGKRQEERRESSSEKGQQQGGQTRNRKKVAFLRCMENGIYEVFSGKESDVPFSLIPSTPTSVRAELQHAHYVAPTVKDDDDTCLCLCARKLHEPHAYVRPRFRFSR